MTRVLIVEDDPWIQWMIADDLADGGYEIMTAHDGFEALERIGEAWPDVIVLDLMLARLDGWELDCNDQTATDGEVIPIVVVSAACSPDLLHRGTLFAEFLRKGLIGKSWRSGLHNCRQPNPRERRSQAAELGA